MICKNCGKEISESSMFCANCGMNTNGTDSKLIIENNRIIEYLGKDKVIEIPEGILSIGKFAFDGKETIEKVIVKSTKLRNIENSAFSGCNNLCEFEINTLKGKIGKDAFSGCSSLVSFVVPRGTMEIEENAFMLCESLKFISVPDTVMSIGACAFGVPTSKTVILASKGSAAEKYAQDNILAFRVDSKEQRRLLLEADKAVKENEVKAFTIFDEEVKADTSLSKYLNLLDYFGSLYTPFFERTVESFPQKFNGSIDTDKINNSLNEQIQGAIRYLENLGVMVNESVFVSEISNERSLHIKFCNKVIEAIEKSNETFDSGYETVRQNLIDEAESKVTGSSFGVIGDFWDVAAVNIGDAVTRANQSKKAYKEAGRKFAEQSREMNNTVNAIHSDYLNNTIIPALKQSTSTIITKLAQVAVEELYKHNILNKESISKYNIAKSEEIISRAEENNDVDKEYAIALSLKNNPANIHAYLFAIKNDCVSQELFNMIEFLGIYKNSNFINNLNDYSYEFISEFIKKHGDLVKEGFNNTINKIIEIQANDLKKEVTNCLCADFCNATAGKEICQKLKENFSAETWGYISQEVDLIDDKKLEELGLSKNDIRGKEGFQRLLNAAKEYADKKVEESKPLALKREIDKTEDKIKQLKKQSAEINTKVSAGSVFGGVIALAIGIGIIIGSFSIDLILFGIIGAGLGAVIGFVGFGIIFAQVSNSKKRKKEKAELTAEILKLKQTKENQINKIDPLLHERKIEDENLEKIKSKRDNEKNAQMQRLAEKRKKSKRRKIIVSVVILIFIVFVAFMYALLTVILPNNQYNKAVACLQDGEYDEAITIFTELGEFKDSQSQIPASYYEKGEKLFSEKKYFEAYEAYMNAGNYSDSVDKANDSSYMDAKRCFDTGDFLNAITGFNRNSSYKDSADLIKLAKYNYIQAHKNNTDLTTYEFLKELRIIKYKDAVDIYDSLYKWNIIKSITFYENHTYGGTWDNRAFDERLEQESGQSIVYQGLWDDNCIDYIVKFSGGPPEGVSKIKVVVTHSTEKEFIYNPYLMGAEKGDPSGYSFMICKKGDYYYGIAGDHIKEGNNTFTLYDENGKILDKKTVKLVKK